jgi:hypothetical protein
MLKVSVLRQKCVTLLPASFAGSRRGPFPTGRISKIGHKKEIHGEIGLYMDYVYTCGVCFSMFFLYTFSRIMAKHG